MPRSTQVRQVPSLIALFVTLSLGGVGCISSTTISNRAVDYNLAAETARMQMLLLNVLRARDRKPMTFTGLTRITGSVRADRRIGVTGSSSGGNQAGVLSPSIGITDSPTFDVAVLDSQEFTRGIMTPLRFDLVEYFWDQGFPREVLLYLVAERIELSCGVGQATEPLRLINDPSEISWQAFHDAVNTISDAGTWEVDRRLAAVGPPLAAPQVESLGSLIMVAGASLELRELEDGRWQLQQQSEGRRLLAPVDAACDPPASAGSGGQVPIYDSQAAFEAARDLSPEEPIARLVLRSPQSVLFYLGELTRPGNAVYIRERSPGQPLAERRLFHITDASQCAASTVAVNYVGGSYVVPSGTGDCHEGRSLQSLALAAQLLSLQQSASSLPVTNTVRIIGQ